MPVVKNLVVPYHPASASSADGAATVQMVLDQIGAAPLPDQAAIEAQIQPNNSEPAYWYSDPDGVKGALVNLKPAAFANTFVVFSHGTEVEASRKITFTLHNYQVATATLVYSGGHWIAVKGVQTDVDPLTNAAYSIDGFLIHNPWPDDPVAGAPSEDVWIDYATWTGTYFTSVVYGPPAGKWLNKFVSVCDPAPLAIGELKPVARRPRASGAELLLADEALEALRQEIDTLGLDSDVRAVRILAGGRPAKPVLVQRLDLQDSLTYAFTWYTPQGAEALIQIDARFGLLREASFFRRAVPYPRFSREHILRLIGGGSIEVVSPGDRDLMRRDRWKRYKVRLRRGTWCLQEALSWQPCWESRSPAYPFHILTVADRHYYISTLDGTIYDRLHPFGQPGRAPQGGA